MPLAAELPQRQDATGLVNQGWQFFQNKSTDLLNKTQYSLDAIAAPLLNLEAPVISYSPIAFETGTFLRPTAPAAPEVPSIAVDLPAPPELADIALAPLPAMPAEPDFSGMTWSKPAAPNVAPPMRPADTDVALVEVEVPDAPAFVMPADPVLYVLDLPTIPDLTLPVFAGVRPTFNLTAPDATLDWAFQQSDRTLVEAIRTQLADMRINGLALPQHIEQAIFDRARGREDILSLQQEQEATRLLSSRGLRSPAGLLSKSMRALRDRARLASSGASRDLAIEIAKENIESIRFGLSQGIAFESALLQDHAAIQGLLLDAAKATQAALMEVFNAKVALHNAQWEGFKAEAQVYETQIRAKAQEVEILKARIDAEKVKGDVNEGLVRAYGEKVRALSALVDMHRAQVDAAKAKGEINVQRLEQVRMRLQTYGIDVDAYAKQFDAYRTQVDAEATGLRYYEALGNVFGQRVNAWKGQVDAQQSRVQSEIAANGQLLDKFRATLAGIATWLQGQSANADVIARIFQSKASMFAAEGQVSAAESAAGDRTNELRMQQARLVFDSAARNAEVYGNFALKKADMAIEGSRGAAQVWSQLAASVLSGVNLGASTSYGESMSWAWSYEGN